MSFVCCGSTTTTCTNRASNHFQIKVIYTPRHELFRHSACLRLSSIGHRFNSCIISLSLLFTFLSLSLCISFNIYYYYIFVANRCAIAMQTMNKWRTCWDCGLALAAIVIARVAPVEMAVATTTTTATTTATATALAPNTQLWMCVCFYGNCSAIHQSQCSLLLQHKIIIKTEHFSPIYARNKLFCMVHISFHFL